MPFMTIEEKKFVAYWEEQRVNKKRFLRRLSIGLPVGALLATAILINFLSGWYKRADAALNSDSSVIIVVVVAMIGIVIFITIFSAHHKWDRNEAFYQELISRSAQSQNDVQRDEENKGLIK
jgi:ATP/ADP translocase